MLDHLHETVVRVGDRLMYHTLRSQRISQLRKAHLAVQAPLEISWSKLMMKMIKAVMRTISTTRFQVRTKSQIWAVDMVACLAWPTITNRRKKS